MALWSEWEGAGLRQDFSRVVTYDDLTQAARCLLGHPAFDSAVYVLGNFSLTQEVQLDATEQRMLLASEGVSLRYRQNLIVLMVATHPRLQELYLGYLDQSFGSSWEYLLVDDLGQARRFLQRVLDNNGKRRLRPTAVDWVHTQRERMVSPRASRRRLRFRW